MIRVVHLSKHNEQTRYGQAFSLQKAKAVRSLHQSIECYAATPLVALNSLAQRLGVAGLFVKDESFRFGLNAFKALGSSYCLASLLAGRLGLGEKFRFGDLVTPEARKALGEMTVITATDGNHGRGVAWTAKQLGCRSVVLMPKGSAAERLENIRLLGADAKITDLVYDDTVQLAARLARENGWILLQDTAWDGYEDIPLRIMQGYLTMALEAAEALNEPPTHVFLQAGVGSMAAALAAFFKQYYANKAPRIVIVEPDGANCFYETALAGDGAIHPYQGELKSIMAGLCCGVPSSIAWDILRACGDDFVSMPDSVAADGMRILGAPLPGDTRILSGESGASCFGLVADVLRKPELVEVKNRLGLGASSRILCISTEGPTDRENYRRVVWDGAYAG
ncbi:MAG TPA: diaminopropionate ammonia-lyase [Candidatus Aphodousia gallistercoris]|nr:diaminopropionate ammonia-lyase [Candidatus Aphodousia gallistercoris]